MTTPNGKTNSNCGSVSASRLSCDPVLTNCNACKRNKSGESQRKVGEKSMKIRKRV